MFQKKISKLEVFLSENEMCFTSIWKKTMYSISVVYSTTCIPFQLFTLSVLKCWPFSPSSSSVWKEKRNTVPTSTSRRKEDLSTALFQGSSESGPMLQASFRTRKNVVSYDSSALPKDHEDNAKRIL